MNPITEPGSGRSSTQPEPDVLPDVLDAPGPADDGDLLGRLRSISEKKVDTAARSINRFSEDDDAHEKRWAKAETRRTFYKIRRWFFWFLFGLVCLVATICSVGYIYLVWLWVGNVVWGTTVKEPQALKDMVTGVLWAILIILATLFGESVFKDKD